MIFDANSAYILLKRNQLSALKNAFTLDLAFYEIGNALLMELRRRALGEASFTSVLRVLKELAGVMRVIAFERLDADSVAKISRTAKLTFYDASYLALAILVQDDLTTEDSRLSEEARKLKIRTYSVT